MKIENLKEGDVVLISQDLTITNHRWAATPEMKKMKGKLYKVRSVTRDYVNIWDDHDNSWTFAEEDILSPDFLQTYELKNETLMKKDPVYFDLKNL